jgi:hypothetical protein
MLLAISILANYGIAQQDLSPRLSFAGREAVLQPGPDPAYILMTTMNCTALIIKFISWNLWTKLQVSEAYLLVIRISVAGVPIREFDTGKATCIRRHVSQRTV